MPYNPSDLKVIKHYMEWLYPNSIPKLTEDQFGLYWRGLSDQERKVEWDKCTLHMDFD